MSRAVHRLSAKAIEKAKEPGDYCDGGGLYLQISARESKSWIFRYSRHGKSHWMGLGSERDVSLAEARTKASDARRQLVDGKDPLAAREGHRAQEKLQKAGSISFADCAKKYIDSHKAGWRNEKHIEQWQNSLDTYAGPVIGELAVNDVNTALVLRILEPIWSKKPETASRVRGRIERILDYARARGYRSGENPALWRGHLDKLLPSAMNTKTREHHAALPYDELPAFVRDLRQQGGNAARALEYLILTTARTGEVIGCEPEKEIDLKKAIWTVPAGRMKAGKEHRVPLSPQAVKVVEGQPEGKYLFSGGKEGAPLSNMAMLELLKRMGRDDLTVHGFRSTFRDWAAECTSYPGEVCEMALAHAITDKVEAAYRRGDLFEKRRLLMLDWARYCGSPKGDVVPLTRKKAVA
jgi:integrase